MTQSSLAFRHQLTGSLPCRFFSSLLFPRFLSFLIKWPQWPVDTVKIALDSDNDEVLRFEHVGDRWPGGSARLLIWNWLLEKQFHSCLTFISSPSVYQRRSSSHYLARLFFNSPFQFNKTKKKKVRFSFWRCRSDDVACTHSKPCSQRFSPSDENLLNWIMNWLGAMATNQSLEQVQLLHCSTFQFTHFNRSFVSWPNLNGLAAAGMWLDSASIAPPPSFQKKKKKKALSRCNFPGSFIGG